MIDDAISRIRAYAAFRNWSRNRLAIEAGLKESTIRGFERADWNPTAETLRKLEAVIPASFRVRKHQAASVSAQGKAA